MSYHTLEIDTQRYFLFDFDATQPRDNTAKLRVKHKYLHDSQIKLNTFRLWECKRPERSHIKSKVTLSSLGLILFHQNYVDSISATMLIAFYAASNKFRAN